MSRSYKKTPYCGSCVAGDVKRRANKRVRIHLKDVENDLPGKTYRKVYESWEIKDYFDRFMTFEEYYAYTLGQWVQRNNCAHYQRYHAHRDEPRPTRKQVWREYKKCYLNK